MDKKTNGFLIWTITGLVLIALTALMVFVAQKEPSNNTTINDPSILRANEHSKGSETATNVLIEYSDFQCPACASYQGVLKTIADELSDKVKIVYRHFPLESIHPNAKIAAQASEAAALQNKFWEMHDKLFDNQSAWSGEKNPEEKFFQYATELGLDLEKFKNDLQSDSVKNKVNEDALLAETLGLNSTPTFFLNGKIIKISSYNQIKNALEQN